jgi:RNA polymerase sigma-70 factor (ECF subfamily)
VGLSLVASDFDDAFAPLFHDAFDIAYRILADGDDAEEAALDALTQAQLRWEKIGRLPYRNAWVMRAAIDAAVANAGKGASSPVLDNGREDDNTVLRAAVLDAVVHLPRRDRDVLALRLIAGFDEANVAACLGISVASVKKHLVRALTSVRDRVGNESAVAS